jgi:hypothetical protein
MKIMKPKTGYCINCDNKHGCKSRTPPCIDDMEEHGVTGRSGKKYLVEEKRIYKCRKCPFLRSCWDTEEYDRVAARLK